MRASLATVVPEDSEDTFRHVLDNLPAAIYVTDARGHILYFNEAAAELWGHRPDLGNSEWCGSWKLFWPDGRVLQHADCPMAIAIKERRIVRGLEAVAERPDGSRVPFRPYPTPLFDKSGRLIGAVNMLVDLSDRDRAEAVTRRLAAIVTSSDDAIISKDLNGIIQSWNRGAEQLFGYTAEEAIGQPVVMLIPEDRHYEEHHILAQLRCGRPIQHYETVRRRKDGSLVDISLSVSPVHNDRGEVIGASKIARDISERRRAAERQHLLLLEMDHRIKNLFALASGLVTLGARTASTAEELATALRGRLEALARAQAFTLPKALDSTARPERPRMLHSLIAAVTAPHETEAGRSSIRVRGADIRISEAASTSLALLIYEFATNAVKYGALSTPSGYVEIDCVDAEQFVLAWSEHDGPRIEGQPTVQGFGSRLATLTVRNQLGGELSTDWTPGGLKLRLAVPRERLAE